MSTCPCERCAYFRPQRNLEQVLGFYETPGISPALERLRDHEAHFARAEAAQKRMLDEQQRDVWPSRPQVVTYCGLQEENGIFHVCEVKNKGQSCADFRVSHSMPLLWCDSCRHRQEARGPERHRRSLEEWRSASSGHVMGEAPSLLSRAYHSIQQEQDSAQSREMQQAMVGGGATTSVPLYYDYCQKYSTMGHYVLCRVRNELGRCPGHSKRRVDSSPEGANPGSDQKTERLWSLGGGF